MQYREVIKPPFWLISFLYFLALSIVLAIWAALGDAPAGALLVFLTLGLAFISFRSRMCIEIADGFLHIDRAKIELKYLGSAEALSSDQMRMLRTRDADPAAYFAIRFWESRGVKVALSDRRDPTPYWLISSRRGSELVKALNNK